MTNATYIQPGARIRTTLSADTYLQGEDDIRTIRNTSSTKAPCGNSGRKKAPQYICGGNKNEEDSTNQPARVCTYNHRQEHILVNVIPTHKQTRQQNNSRAMDEIICK